MACRGRVTHRLLGVLEMLKALVTAGVISLSMTSASSAASVIFSDNFDGEAYGLNQDLDNWTVTDGTIDVIGTGFFEGVAGGGTFLDMDGSTEDSGRITSIASFFVVAGEQYELAFSYGKNGTGAETLSFGFGGWLGALPLAAGALSGFTSTLISFTATTTGNSSLFFENSGGDNQGALLDNVALSAVPLPAGGLLLIGGLAALAGLRRRKLA